MANIRKTPAQRPERTPIHERSAISYKGMDPNYSYRLVNDTHEGERIQTFLDAGYEFVHDTRGLVGDVKVDGASSLGSQVTKHVGGGTKGFLMRIPKDLYDEDQRAKMAKQKANEDALRHKLNSDREYFGRVDF